MGRNYDALLFCFERIRPSPSTSHFLQTMETPNKKTPISFASAAAGKTPSTSGATTPTATTAAAAPSGTSGPATKNGSNASSNQSSPALGSQSPALAST